MKTPTPPLDEDQKLQICLERDRLLCDPEFKRSPKMVLLLKFLVDHRLASDNLPLKAYTIAVDALGREESFDTDLDSYPRVQIARLRKMLDHFYQREGGDNRLSIPLHDYTIKLEPNVARANESASPVSGQGLGIEQTTDVEALQPASLSRQTSAKWSNWRPIKFAAIATSIVILLLSAAVYSYYFSKPAQEIMYPSVFVKETSGAQTPMTQATAKSANAYLVNAFSKFEHFRVSNAESTLKQAPLYTLDSLVVDETRQSIQFVLVDDSSKQVIWSDTIELAPDEQLNDQLVKIVVAIAAPYGAVEQAELSKHRGDFTAGYACILQFHQFARYRDLTIASSLRNCLRKSALFYPNDPYLFSMLAIAKSVSERFGAKSTIGPPAIELAHKAALLDNKSAAANFAVAQVAFLEGDCETGVAWGKRAVQLNPLNSRIAGYYGLYLLGCNLPEGEEYTLRALEMDPNTDLAVAAALAFQKLKRGDTLAAQQLSSKYMVGALQPEPGLELTYVLSTAALGNKPEARRMWKKLTSRLGFSEHTPIRQVLKPWVANPKLVDEIVLNFEKIELYN